MRTMPVTACLCTASPPPRALRPASASQFIAYLEEPPQFPCAKIIAFNNLPPPLFSPQASSRWLPTQSSCSSSQLMSILLELWIFSYNPTTIPPLCRPPAPGSLPGQAAERGRGVPAQVAAPAAPAAQASIKVPFLWFSRVFLVSYCGSCAVVHPLKCVWGSAGCAGAHVGVGPQPPLCVLLTRLACVNALPDPTRHGVLSGAVRLR